jgi:HAMP domain-containing protein
MTEINSRTSSGETEGLKHSAWRLSLVTAVLMAVLSVYLLITPTTNSDYMVLFALISVLAFASAWLSKRGHSNLGIGLVLLALNFAIIYSGITRAGLGGILAALALVFNLGVSTLTLPRKLANRANIVAFVLAPFVILFDLFAPFERSIVELPIYGWLVVIVLFLGYGLLIIRQFGDYPLRTKLIIAFMTVTIISMGMITGVVSLNVRNTLRLNIGQQFAALANDQLTLIENFFLEKISQLQVLRLSDILRETVEDQLDDYEGSQDEILAQILELDEHWLTAPDNDPLVMKVLTPDEDINWAGEELEDFLEEFGDHTEVFISDRYGALVSSTGRTSDYYQADEDWWQAAWNQGRGALFISSQPEYDESADIDAILIALPIYDEEREAVIGILRSTLVVDSLYQLIAQTTVGESGHVVLWDQDGNVLFDPRLETVNSAELPAQELAHIFSVDDADAHLSEDEYFDTITNQLGQELIIGHASLDQIRAGELHARARFLTPLEKEIVDAVSDLGWVALLRQDTSEALEVVGQSARTILLVAILVMGLAVAGAAVFAQVLVRPISNLADVAEKYGTGDLDARADVSGQDEIGALASAFNEMAAQMRSLFEGLERRVADRTRALETSNEVGRRLSTILSQNELVSEVVEQVQRAFDYYHTQIYLFDENREHFLMMGGTGEAGKTMLARGHKIPKGQGLVGRSGEFNRTVLVADVSLDKEWLPNPMLPETKSEIAVPIALGEDVLGVLDVQQDVANGLGDADAELLQLISNQVAAALQNARSYQAAQQQAQHEALITDIGQRIQSTTDIDEALQVAVREMGRALGTETRVKLHK